MDNNTKYTNDYFNDYDYFNDHTDMIRVQKLLVDNNIYKLNNNLNNNIYNFNNLIKYLEYILVDFIDDHMKFALKKYGSERIPSFTDNPNENLQYYLTGGKAINQIVNNYNLNKSFDFDIHLFFGNNFIVNNNHKLSFSKRIAKYMFEEFDQDGEKKEWVKFKRAIIFNKLKKYDLVDDENLHHYYSDKLFYYGRSGDLCNSLFIKLELKKNLFNNISYTNNLNVLYGNGRNIIYLPFANIGSDSIINFDLKIADETIHKNDTNITLLDRFDYIYYSNYYYILYNLINYICINKYKRKNNLLKMNKISNPFIYNLKFINSINESKIKNYEILFEPQSLQVNFNIINNNILFINQNSYDEYLQKIIKERIIIDNNSFENYNRIDTIMYDIFDIFITNKTNIENKKRKLCIGGSRSRTTVTNSYNYLSRKYEFINIFSDGDFINRINRHEELLFKLVRVLDFPENRLPVEFRETNTFGLFNTNSFGFIREYTTPSYSRKDTYNYIDLNMYCNLKALNLGLENELGNKVLALTPDSNFSTSLKYNEIVQIIDNIFNKFNHTVTEKINNNTLKIGKKIGNDDWFDVFSCQHLISLFYNDTGESYEILNFDTLKTGDVIEIAQYISTTFANIGGPLDNFLKTNEIKRKLFKIRVNAKYNNWLYLGKHSTVGYEQEILLKRGSKFIVTNKTNEIIMHLDDLYDNIELIELEILPSYNDLNKLNQVDKLNQVEFDNYIFDLIKQKTFQKSGFGSYYDLVFKSKIFLHTTKYVYETYLKNPYKDSELCKKIKKYCKLNGNAGDNEKLKIIQKIYIKNGFDISDYDITKFNHHINSLQYMHINLNRDYDEIDEKGIQQKGTYNRPTYGLSHTLRVSIFGQFIALNLLKFNTFPLVTELITQEFLIKIGIVLLFYVTGRESEASLNIKNLYCCVNSKKSDNNPRLRYANKSIEYLKKYIIKINNDMYDNKLFIDDEINNYADAINNNYNITNEIKNGDPELVINDLSKLLKYIFYSAHAIDLTRIIGKNIIITTEDKIKLNTIDTYYIYSPIKFNNMNINEFIINNKLLVSNIQKVFYFTGTESNNIRIHEDEDEYIIPPYDDLEINIIKYKCQTDYKYCIEKILEASNYYIYNLIETLSLKTLLFFDKHKDLIDDLEGGRHSVYKSNFQSIQSVSEHVPVKKFVFEHVPETVSKSVSKSVSEHVPELNYYKEEDDNLYDIEDIYNIENNKIEPYYLYLSKKLNIEESENNKYKFRKTFISMDQIKNLKEEKDFKKKRDLDLYSQLNTIIENKKFK